MIAGEAMVAATMAGLRRIAELNGVHEMAPIQAAFPYATVEVGPESDWSHKSGRGREMRIAVIVRDKGERPTRLRRLAAELDEALGGIETQIGTWRLVTMSFLRARLIRESNGVWAAINEYRARLMEASDL